MTGTQHRHAYSWQAGEVMDFAVRGVSPIRGRGTYLVDVPDVLLVPDRRRRNPAVTFRAGTELASQNRTLWALSWLVRWGLVTSLLPVARWIAPLRRMTSWLGSERSAMVVRLFGTCAGHRIERRWTLLAEQGDGPRIPALSVPPLVRQILSGNVAPGARDAGCELALTDYEAAFGLLAVRHALTEVPQPPPLYRRIMGEAFDRLPAEFRAIHGVLREGVAVGTADEVLGAANWLGRIVAAIMRFPPAGSYPVQVWFTEREGVERWRRRFGGHEFASTLSQNGSGLVERFGPIRFSIALDGDAPGLRMRLKQCLWTAAKSQVLPSCA